MAVSFDLNCQAFERTDALRLSADRVQKIERWIIARCRQIGISDEFPDRCLRVSRLPFVIDASAIAADAFEFFFDLLDQRAAGQGKRVNASRRSLAWRREQGNLNIAPGIWRIAFGLLTGNTLAVFVSPSGLALPVDPYALKPFSFRLVGDLAPPFESFQPVRRGALLL